MGHRENAGEMIDRKSWFMANQGQRCRRAAAMIHLAFGGVREPSANAPRRLVVRSIDILSCIPATGKVKARRHMCMLHIYLCFSELTMGIFASFGDSA
jgi:hypothetical protein